MKVIKTNEGFVEYSIDEGVVILEKIEIKKELRGKGFGTKLLKKFEEKVENEGYNRIELCAYPQEEGITLEGLRKFYENNGYEVEYDTGNEILMFKII